MQEILYDETFWEDLSLSFPPQDLPSWDDFYAAYPKVANTTSWLTGAENVFPLIGGDVEQAYVDYGIVNTCAAKVSIALNNSGVTIPSIESTATIPGTLEGGGDNEGKYYFLNAKALVRC